MIFLYCISADGNQRPLLAYNYGGEWVEEGLDSYGPGQSALPSELGVTSVINLDHFNNYFYIGESDGLDDEELKLALTQQENWQGSDTQRFGLSDVTSSSHKSMTSMTTTALAVVVSSLLLLHVIFA